MSKYMRKRHLYTWPDRFECAEQLRRAARDERRRMPRATLSRIIWADGATWQTCCSQLADIMCGDTCRWRVGDKGTWWTDCGKTHLFGEEGPKANGFEFCPYCSGRIEEGSIYD